MVFTQIIGSQIFRDKLMLGRQTNSRILRLCFKGITDSLDHSLEKTKRIILRKPGSEGFVLAFMDEFALEVELLWDNGEFIAYLDALFNQEATISLEDVEKELGL